MVLVFSNIDDPETDIQYIEYAIGTASESTDILDWHNAGIVNNSSFYYHQLGMSRGNTYYIGVRTTNGVNVKSQEFWTSIYIQ